MRLFAATLFAVLAFASPAFATPVTNVGVDNTKPSSAAGARTTYAVKFTTSATGGLSQADNSRITFGFPTGTTFSGWLGGDVRVGGTAVGNCSSPNNSVVECSLFSGRTIAAGTAVEVDLNGVTNAGTQGARTLAVSTTADTTVVDAPFNVAIAGTLTEITLANASPSNAAGARTSYVARFKVSATGGMAQTANSKIDVLFPGGTGYLGWFGGVVRDVTRGVDVGNCSTPSNGTVQCGLFSNQYIDPGDTVQLTLNGITNTTPAGDQVLRVDTTSDPALLPSAPFSVVGAGALTNVTLANATPSAAAGARTNYVLGFTTSGTGGLAQEANSKIDVTFPAGTTFPGWFGGTVSVGGVDVGNCSSPSGLNVQCGLFTDRTIAPNTNVTITFAGVTNTSAGTGKVVSVSTTSDQAANSAPFNVVAAGPLTGVTVANANPTSAAGARTNYILGFTTSATGGLAQKANSKIDIAFPAGTTFPGWFGGTISVGGTDVGNCSSPSGLIVQCGLFTDRTIAPNTNVTITFSGVTNATAGTGKVVTVSTTSDPSTITSAPFSVAGANPLTGLTVAVSSLTPSARTRYVVRFTVSTTGGLAQVANSRIDLALPVGTTFTGWSGGTVHDDTSGFDVGNCASPSGLTVQCGLFSTRTVATGHNLRITFDNITNPPTLGPYQLKVSTTSDPAQVTSSNYTQGEPVSPETAIESDTTSGTTTKFTFSSAEPGSRFECRINNEPFTACASPYTTPPGLPAGTHTFQVRALDAAGNPDPTPSSRSFTVAGGPTPTPVATTAPTPTATPTPSPTPEFRKDVVVAPVSGTVEVCDKPGVNCRKLAAGAEIPMNSTVDARKGVIELSSITSGGVVQKAKFYDGMFKVTQSAATTDLTLNEPLASCSKKKKARAAAKKPKSRRLWGDGQGKFRTRGQYSAATIRGTKWLVQDSCAGTLTQVKQGVVSVRDEVKKKTVTLRAGKRYLAKPR